MSILHIDSSFSGKQSASALVSAALVDQLAQIGDGQVRYRDLSAQVLPHLNEEIFSGFALTDAERNEAQREAAALSDHLIDELRKADTLVLGIPMYNFSAPSVFKSWIDFVARAGVSFRYTSNGPEGLLDIDKAFVVATRGGRYANSGNDHQAPWIEQVLKFIGVKEVEFIYVEGMAGPDRQDTIDATVAGFEALRAA